MIGQTLLINMYNKYYLFKSIDKITALDYCSGQISQHVSERLEPPYARQRVQLTYKPDIQEETLGPRPQPTSASLRPHSELTSAQALLSLVYYSTEAARLSRILFYQ